MYLNLLRINFSFNLCFDCFARIARSSLLFMKYNLNTITLTSQEHGKYAEDFLSICDWRNVSETNCCEDSVGEIERGDIFGPHIRSTQGVIL